MNHLFKGLITSLLLAFFLCQGLLADTAQPVTATPSLESSEPSSKAQELYTKVQQDLLQLRVLLKNGKSQSAIGSGFLIGESSLVVTNFHVVSQIALEPDTYIGEYKDTQGKSGALKLIAVDVLHDLAIVRVDRKGTGVFNIPFSAQEKNQPPIAQLQQGQHLYSLGNPLDLGFTISEGTYNGISARGFSDQLMFTGAVNPGMSGGPNITADGTVAGVNVAHRRDGELVSFLVPAVYVQLLLTSIDMASLNLNTSAPTDFKKMIGEQLLQHQAVMVAKLLEQPFDTKELGPYRVPVRESDQVRCWGSTDDSDKKHYSYARINCSMESAVFVSDDLQTGMISLGHTYLTNKKLNAMQFAQLASTSFAKQVFSTAKSDNITSAQCAEDFIIYQTLPMRALVCAEAYHKFDGLYDFTLTTASTDNSQRSLQSMMNIQGVSFENGKRLIEEFIKPFSVDKKNSNKNSSNQEEITP
jgi:serine protease Do